MHPAHQPGRAPRRAQRPGLLSGRRPFRSRRGRHQALSDQPRRIARGLARPCRHPHRQAARPRPGRSARRLQRARRGRPAPLPFRPRARHGLRRHCLLPAVLQKRTARPHDHRNQDDRHLLVGPLPPHHLRHPPHRRRNRRRNRAGRLRQVSGYAPRTRPRRPPREPDGHGHDRRQVPEEQGHPQASRRIGRDQRLHRESEGRRRRRGPRLALPLQERNPQPPHRNRALRRRGHLHRRLHPRPPERAQLRLPGHARHGRGRPHGTRFADHGRQAAPAQARDHRRGRLFELRQPDRPCHRPGRRALPPRLRGQAHGNRRRGRRHAGRPRGARRAPARGRGRSLGRPYRP